ncbi:MAG: hypothetical protein H8M99_10785 [Gloeobacteraceae cyanobacterium ES-bin-144]|nr:hypothetical protein [Verrucomicrobiales bacterium]
MNRLICTICVLFGGLAMAQEDLRPALEQTYNNWREAIIRKDYAAWQKFTAEHRRVEIKNRILSEKRAFPGAIFDLPTPPPSIKNLRFLEAKKNAITAKASYFGKVDFGVGGEPTENLLVLSFVNSVGGWLYDRADYVNLAGLPEVRKELAGGDIKYLKETPEAQPSGVVPSTPMEVRPAKYIAKVYVFCPGREVQVQVNKISRHRFVNAKESEIVIGGAIDGPNEVQFTTKKLDGGTGKEAISIRVYLMSQVVDVKPIKIFEYQVAEDQPVKPFVTENFQVDAEVVAKISGR